MGRREARTPSTRPPRARSAWPDGETRSMIPLAALSAGKAILIGIASGLAVILVGGASLAAMRRARPGGPDIPPAMRPGPSDTDLEKPVLERLYVWGLVMVLILA